VRRPSGGRAYTRGVDGGVVGCAIEPLLAAGGDAQGGGAR